MQRAWSEDHDLPVMLASAWVIWASTQNT